MLGLILFCLLLTVNSGQKEIHVFSSDGENANLPCHDALTDCTSTTWTYYDIKNSRGVSLFAGGTKMNDTERRERLSLGSDCSLNIYKATTEDHGVYNVRLVIQKTFIDSNVYLHILHVTPPSTQSEMKPGSSVTLSCQLYVYDGYACESLLFNAGVQLIWVNEAGVNLQTDSRYQISSSEKYCNVSLTTKLLNEDDKKEWKCQIAKGSEVKTSVSYTVTYLATASGTTTEVILAVTAAVAAVVVFIVLWLICKYGADKKADPAFCETISSLTPATPPTLHVHGKTEDVTYAEVTVCKERQNVQSDDKVTYAAVRGAKV